MDRGVSVVAHLSSERLNTYRSTSSRARVISAIYPTASSRHTRRPSASTST